MEHPLEDILEVHRSLEEYSRVVDFQEEHIWEEHLAQQDMRLSALEQVQKEQVQEA